MLHFTLLCTSGHRLALFKQMQTASTANVTDQCVDRIKSAGQLHGQDLLKGWPWCLDLLYSPDVGDETGLSLTEMQQLCSAVNLLCAGSTKAVGVVLFVAVCAHSVHQWSRTG